MNNLDILKKSVEEAFQIEDLKLSRRYRKFVDARRVFSFIAVKQLDYSLSHVGGYLNQTHCTVIHSVKTFKDLIIVDKDLKNKLDRANKLFAEKSELYISNIPELKSRIIYHKECLKELNNKLELVKNNE